MRILKLALMGMAAIAAGVGIGMVPAVGQPAAAAIPIIADIQSRPIAGPSPAPRVNQTFTVWHSVKNNGPQAAENVTLVINPITDPNVFVQGITTNPPRPCTPVGVTPVVCTLGKVGIGPVLAVGIRYIAVTAGSYATDQAATTTSTDPNPANNNATAVITVTP